MSFRSKLRRAAEYLEHIELVRARARGVRVDFVAILVDLRDRFDISPATLIDAGANRGEYTRAVRFLFPDAEALLFEPIEELADALRSEFGPLGARVFPFALDSQDRTASFFRTRAADLSSLLAPTAELTNLITDGANATRADRIEIEARRFDSIVDLASARRPVLFKLDVQGAELAALEGSTGALAHVDCIQLEFNFALLYEGQAALRDLLAFTGDHGFSRFVQVDPHIAEGHLSSCDFLFFRD